jgi:putative ABC transport system substrate-binding protein
MTTRRDLLLLLSAGGLPLGALAQGRREPLRIAWFSEGNLERHKPYVEAFRTGLRELGYDEGKNIAIEYYWRDETVKTFRWIAADIARARPDVIVATCEVAVSAARRATDSIPIVMAASTDPVAHGLVQSLGRPGGNITGLSFNEIEAGVKRLDLLREVVPQLKKVGVVMLADEPVSDTELKALGQLIRGTRYELLAFEIRSERDFARAFEDMRKAGVHGVLDYSSLSVTFPFRKQFTRLALEARIPVAYHLREMVEAGGFMSYGPVATESFRRAAYYIDRIARGARPAELPIEQPTRFELAVNLGTAKALGVTVPQSILVRADRVIE